MPLKKRIDTNRLPDHVAIIMDGNGRWAQRRMLTLRLQLAGLIGDGQLGPPLCVLFEGWDASGKGGAREKSPQTKRSAEEKAKPGVSR